MSNRPVDSSHVTQGDGIPDADLDGLIAATVPDGDSGERISDADLSEGGATLPSMNTTIPAPAPDPALPPGAVSSSECEPGESWVCEGPDLMPAHLVDEHGSLYAVTLAGRDGRPIIDDTDAPCVSTAFGHLDPADARALAAALTEAADLADQWAGMGS